MNWGPLKVWRFGTGQDECLIHNAIIMLCFFFKFLPCLVGGFSSFWGIVLLEKRNNDQQPPEKKMVFGKQEECLLFSSRISPGTKPDVCFREVFQLFPMREETPAVTELIGF